MQMPALSIMKLLLVALLVAIVAASEIDRPSPQAINPSVCVTKLGDKPGDKCACKVWIKGKVNPPEYYLKWTCPNADPNRPVPTAAYGGTAAPAGLKATTKATPSAVKGAVTTPSAIKGAVTTPSPDKKKSG